MTSIVEITEIGDDPVAGFESCYAGHSDDWGWEVDTRADVTVLLHTLAGLRVAALCRPCSTRLTADEIAGMASAFDPDVQRAEAEADWQRAASADPVVTILGPPHRHVGPWDVMLIGDYSITASIERKVTSTEIRQLAERVGALTDSFGGQWRYRNVRVGDHSVTLRWERRRTPA